LRAAELAFAARGFQAARLADIAKQAGITRPSLLYHFQTKEALHTAVLHAGFAELRVALGERMQEPGAFGERVVALMKAYLDFLDGRPTFAPLVLREFIDRNPVVQQVLAEEIVPLLDLVEKWLEAAGEGVLPDGVHLRAALVQLCSDALLQAAAGPLRDAVWGGASRTLEMTERLFTQGTVT